jgi:Uncharacterized protein conserved in bacteria (DUF2344)
VLNDESTKPRQRWRIVFERDADVAGSLMPGTPALEAFATGLAVAGVAIARAGNRSRLALAAPLPVGMSGDRELADMFVAGRYPIAPLRLAVERALPAGHRLVDLHDAWLGEPALAAQLEAADYRIVLAPVGGGADALDATCRRLLEADSLPRLRTRGGRVIEYDLRPLLADVGASDSGESTVLKIRTRFSPERGVGRPEDVLATIAEAAGVPLTARQTSRVRLWLASDLGPSASGVFEPARL